MVPTADNSVTLLESHECGNSEPFVCRWTEEDTTGWQRR